MRSDRVSLAGAVSPTGVGDGGGGMRQQTRGAPTGSMELACCRGEASRREDAAEAGYLPAAWRWKRVRFSIFLCFFLRMRLRRFLISEPMASGNLAVRSPPCETTVGRGAGGLIGAKLGGRDSNPEDVDQNHACCQLHHPRSVAQPYWSR